MKPISIFEAADAFLLEKVFQKFSNFFQKTTGKTCFFLAKIAIILSSSFMIISVVAIPDKNFLPLLIFLALVYACIIWCLTNLIDSKERRIFKSGAFVNHGKLALFPLRLLSWFLLLLEIIICRGKGWEKHMTSARYLQICAAFFICWVYFSSCTPQSPGKSRIKEWVKSLGKFFSKKRLALCPAKECLRV